MLNYKTICVVGDVMLDEYIHCTPRKISAEAPILILNKKEIVYKLGGAANVAFNIKSLGYEPNLNCLCGLDNTRDIIQNLCFKEEININTVTDENIVTSKKTRIIAEQQQIVRVDDEFFNLSKENNKIEVLKRVIEQELSKSESMLISDYDKGTVKVNSFVQDIIYIAKSHGIHVFVDPVRHSWEKYHGAFCITPNLSELEEFVGINTHGDKNKIEDVSRILIDRYKFDNVVVTLGSHGACLIPNNGESIFIPSIAQDVFDVCGAGDTLIAALCCNYIKTKDLKQSLKIANIAAGIVVKKHGTSIVTNQEIEEVLRSNG